MPLCDSCIYDDCRFRNGLKFLRYVKTLEAFDMVCVQRLNPPFQGEVC
jgi:hypothetical protein